MKSGKLHFLEPCGPIQACNGPDLPIIIIIIIIIIINYHNVSIVFAT